MVDDVDSSMPYLNKYPHPYQKNVLPETSVHLCFSSAQMVLTDISVLADIYCI